jgi:uncharacterized membrane protein
VTKVKSRFAFHVKPYEIHKTLTAEVQIMVSVQKTITVNAPVEQVYDYVTNPANMPEVWPSLVEIKDVAPLPDGGHQYRWVYKMAGMRFEGNGRNTDLTPPQRVVAINEGGIESKLDWTFAAAEGGTTVNLDVEYTVPLPLLGRLAEAIIVRQNEREMELLLANLKARLET